MNVLVATARTQGTGPGDFCWTVEGELVYLGPVCGRDRDDPDDGGCGCGRAFAGLSSQRSTTTALVDLDISRGDYLQAVAAGLDQAGWRRQHAGETAEALLAVAVVEQRVDAVHERI